jgi:hypothetical protein
MSVLAAVPDYVRESQAILRDGSTFEWSTVAFLALVAYVYAVEVERRRYDIILAGVAFWLMDGFNELVNSAIFHVSDRAPLWAVTGDTSYLILIGLTIEISILFAIAGVVFVKQLPADRSMRILGVPNRVFLVLAFSIFAVFVEVLLWSADVFHWEYWWWNFPNVTLIVLLGYATFFGAAAWVYDTRERAKQLRIVGAIAAIDVVLILLFGPILGWI